MSKKSAKTKESVLSEVHERIRTIIAEQLIVDETEVTPLSKLQEDLGANSLDLVELVMILEESFELEITDADAEKMITVEQVVKFVENKMDEKEG